MRKISIIIITIFLGTAYSLSSQVFISKNASFDRYIEITDTLLKNEKYRKAASTLLSALEKYENNTYRKFIINYYLIDAYLNIKKFEEAVTSYKEIVELQQTGDFTQEELEKLEPYFIKMVNKREIIFEKYILEAQNYSNALRYDKAVDLLNEAVVQFPGLQTIGVNYNIGYNYYSMKNFKEAISYFNRVIQMFEDGQLTTAEKIDNRKFVILSRTLLNMIEEEKEQRKDPYHIQEDLDKRKKKRPQKEL